MMQYWHLPRICLADREQVAHDEHSMADASAADIAAAKHDCSRETIINDGERS
jgi:hypothetical protein